MTCDVKKNMLVCGLQPRRWRSVGVGGSRPHFCKPPKNDGDDNETAPAVIAADSA